MNVKGAGGTPKLLDKFGVEKPLNRTDNGYAIPLEQATNRNNPDSPDKAMMGGNPVLLIEDGASQTVGNTLG